MLTGLGGHRGAEPRHMNDATQSILGRDHRTQARPATMYCPGGTPPGHPARSNCVRATRTHAVPQRARVPRHTVRCANVIPKRIDNTSYTSSELRLQALTSFRGSKVCRFSCSGTVSGANLTFWGSLVACRATYTQFLGGFGRTALFRGSV